MFARAKYRRTSLVLFASALAACGGGSDTPTNPIPKGFAVSLSANSLSVQQGASGSITATIARTGDFTGTVNLSVEGLPTGITASFSPSAITSSTTSTTLSVAAASSVAPGPYTFTIRGQATGLTDQTATVSVTVTAAPSIALSLSPTSASVAQGASATTTATLTRTNFAGAVTVAVSSTGGATLTPTITTTGDVSTIALAVAAATAPGTYTVTVSASGTGVTTATATFTLTVTAAAAASIAISASPATLSIQAGGAAVSSVVTITRTNFTGAVVVAAQSGVPTGVTLVNSPTGPTTGNSVVVSFLAGATTAPGNYTVVLQGAGNGAAAGTTQIALTVTAAAASSIALSAAPTALTSNPSATVTSALTITRTNFTGNVTLAVTGEPGGITATVAPTPTSGTTATLSVAHAAGRAAPTPGIYPLTITASGSGVANATTVVTLTVPGAVGSIALSATPNALTVQAGATAATTINIARTNFSGSVALAGSGAPSGVTLTLSPTSTTTNSAQLSVGVGASVAPGNYTITVTGTGTGITAAQTTIALTVAPASSGNISWQFCGAATSVPIWLAVQNGNSSAPWTQVAVGANNTYSFTITNSGGVAWVTQGASGAYSLTIFYGSRTEFGATNQCGSTSPNNKTLTGTVTGFTGPTDFASMNFGGASSAGSITSLAPNFSISNAPDGVHDLIGTRSSFNLQTASLVLGKIYLKRGLNPPNNSSLGTIDFGGADAFDPDTKQLTISGLNGGENVTVSNAFTTSTGSVAALATITQLTGSVTPISTVPSAKTVAGDYHTTSVIAAVTNGSVLTSYRTVIVGKKDPGDQTITLGPVLNTPSISVLSSSPYVRLRSLLTLQPEYQSSVGAIFTQAVTGAVRTTLITTFSGYLAGSNTFDASIPDFTTTAGWQNLWGLQPGATVTWTTQASGWVSGNGGIADGTEIRVGLRQGTVNPGISK